MATSEIKDKFGAATAFTITLASLTNGSARQSTLLTNNTGSAGAAGTGQPRALVYVRIKSGGSAPTAAEVADAVWDEATAGHVAAGSFGKAAASA